MSHLGCSKCGDQESATCDGLCSKCAPTRKHERVVHRHSATMDGFMCGLSWVELRCDDEYGAWVRSLDPGRTDHPKCLSCLKLELKDAQAALEAETRRRIESGSGVSDKCKHGVSDNGRKCWSCIEEAGPSFPDDEDLLCEDA